QMLRALAPDAFDLGLAQGRLDSADYTQRDLVLQGENIVDRAVIALGPDMPAGVRFDQLASDADAGCRLAHAAFEHIAHPELASDLANVWRLALVSEARISRDHEQPFDARQAGDDVLNHAVDKIILLGISAHVLERQHRDRRSVR